MFQVPETQATSKPQHYLELTDSARALLEGECDLIANAANLSALIYTSLVDVNWVGFYLMKDGELVVGPFQGLPACVRIPMGKGVCGTAAQTGQTQVVKDVHAFPGHIACDARSRSEIVVPIALDGKLIGVFDVDSPVPDRFDEEDRVGMEGLVQVFVDSLKR